jgi:hypothetical protein
MIRSWHCPECRLTSQTRDDGTGVRYHQCPKLRGLATPMLLAGVKAKLTLHEWDDYIGSEMVQLDPERRRPVRSIVTTRDNGQDVVVLAPTATARR